MTELDSILSGNGAVAPAPETPAKVETPEVKEPAGTEAEVNQQGEHEGQKMVPHEALHAEKQKVKRYTEQVAEFERKQAERDAAWERRLEQILTSIKPQQPAEEQKAPDFYEDPNAFVKSALTPVQQQIQQQREEMSLVLAEEKHGADTVKTALEALKAEMLTNPAAQGDYQAIMKARHPYGALVDWHKKRQATAEIGDDPAAYRERLKAELLAELQGSQPAPAANPVVMPSNLAGARNVGSRSGPAWSGPQSLNDIFDRSRPTK